jgi:uncharacterized membrane protein
MTAGWIGGGTWLLGVVLVVLGTSLSLADWRKKRRQATRPGTFQTDELSVPETLTALAKLFEALKGYPLGRYLIAIGLVLILLGAIVSTGGALAG